MLKRVPQPPVNPALRKPERHEFWPAFIAVVIAGVIILFGARHMTAVETVDGSTAWETQLVKACATGGFQYPSQVAPPPPPPKPDDPAAAAAALELWERQSVAAANPKWKVRIDTASKAACPT